MQNKEVIDIKEICKNKKKFIMTFDLVNSKLNDYDDLKNEFIIMNFGSTMYMINKSMMNDVLKINNERKELINKNEFDKLPDTVKEFRNAGLNNEEILHVII